MKKKTSCHNAGNLVDPSSKGSIDNSMDDMKKNKSSYPSLKQRKIANNKGGGIGGGGASGKWHDMMNKSVGDPLKNAYTYGKKVKGM